MLTITAFNFSVPRYWGLIGGSVMKKSSCQCSRHRRHGFDHWLRRIPCRRKWWPIPVFCLENSMDRGAWQATLHGVAKRWTWLSTHAPHITECLFFFFLLASIIYTWNIKHNKIAYLINMLLFFCKCIYCLAFSLILGNFEEELEGDL